jgi:hypothetical protein
MIDITSLVLRVMELLDLKRRSKEPKARLTRKEPVQEVARSAEDLRYACSTRFIIAFAFPRRRTKGDFWNVSK